MTFLSLFTTPATPAAPPAAAPTAGSVAGAVRQGAERSGVNFEYLMRTARRESALDPDAKAATSTATGLFQFIEQTWLATVKADGAKHGLQRYQEAITAAPGGRLKVADPALRAEILALRRNPEVSAALAGELAKRNGAVLAAALGREPSEGELYLAHVMGARGATSLIRQAAASPDDKAAPSFPSEAGANRNIFYTRNGRMRSLANVRDRLTNGFSTDATVAAAAQAATAAPASSAWLSFFPQTDPSGADRVRVMDGLFRTEGKRGPISQSVARLWAKSDDAAPRADAYFPTGASDVLSPPQVTPSGARPAVTPAPTPASAPAAPRRGRAPGRPLDLQGLMKPVAT